MRYKGGRNISSSSVTVAIGINKKKTEFTQELQIRKVIEEIVGSEHKLEVLEQEVG